ncbi:MAG: dihydroorotate dehydrogenase-like protein [Bacteroidetes bacterium]|jgi:dihydroorotate dehydrogenase (fumarate)|nr:dihydroorotate dehydrogenase-like protein [Bacteroidota bacterium]
MADLSTKYAGLILPNPVVVSSSGLTSSLDKLVELEKMGAGAVVLKSVFEEQINYEIGNLVKSSEYPEAEDYLTNYVKSNTLDAYLELIESAKKSLTIPVIASINCISATDWVNFAKKIESAGADALEINVFYVPNDPNSISETYEHVYFDIAEKLRARVKLPLIFKIGQFFTNPLFVVKQLYFRKINGVVLFNRFYAPDIDLKSLRLTSAEVFSNPSDIRQTLRWVGMMSDQFEKLSISASTGVHDAEAVIKLLLAGANTVQVCSALYKNGTKLLKNIISDMNKWLDKNDFASVREMRGKLNYQNIPDPASYERVQFMKYFSSHQ